jgi:hypothetical protein
MIANADVARRISELVLDGYQRIEQSMKVAEENSTPEQFAAYKRAVGKVTATILFEILEPLYEQNPTLKPDGWDD